jgi:hypothetical protein
VKAYLSKQRGLEGGLPFEPHTNGCRCPTARCDCPPKVLDVADDQPFRIQLRFADLSRKNYGESRQNQYAYQQAAILHNS